MPSSAKIPDTLDSKLLGLYLNDHLAGATAGTSRIMRMVRSFTDLPYYADLVTVAEQIQRERDLVQQLIEDLDLPQRKPRQAVAWLAEKAGRLKLNGRLVRRSPMTPLLETELMRAGIEGKLGLWETLETLAPDLGLEPARFAELANDARKQIETLTRIHEHVRARAFNPSSSLSR